MLDVSSLLCMVFSDQRCSCCELTSSDVDPKFNPKIAYLNQQHNLIMCACQIVSFQISANFIL